MRLADAILIGNTLKVCDPTQWLSWDGKCGCALGGAILACGESPYVVAVEAKSAEGIERYGFLKLKQRGDGITTSEAFSETATLKRLWPWITSWHVKAISTMYCEVANGERTIESLAAVVDSWEPHLDSPESVTTNDEVPLNEKVRA